MAEKIRFFPLDVTYKAVDGKPVIYLFGRTNDNKQVCVLYDKFRPYFYVIPKKEANIAEKLKEFSISRNGEIISISGIEIIKKNYIGNEVDAIKVFVKLPRDVPVLREELKRWKEIESVNENDILFTKRFMIDNNIIPIVLCDAEGEFVNEKLKVPAFRAEKLEQTSTETYLKPRVLCVDIETYTPAYREIDPEKNPIIMLALYGSDMEKVFVWKKFKTNLGYVEFVESESELIEKFKAAVESYHPDIITGYFSDGFDLPYIKTRANKYKIKLDLGLDFSELEVEKRKYTTAQINGIVHFDSFKFIRKIVSGTLETDTYDLGSVAYEMLGEKKHKVDLDALSKDWNGALESMDEFCGYNLNDAQLSYKLTEKLMPIISEMVKVTGLTIYDVNRMGFSQLVEWYLLKQAKSFNEIAPNKPSNEQIAARKMQTYQGAFVFAPKPGLYKDVVVFDYRSLYPTIIGSHNIGLGTLNCKCCEGEAKFAPIDGKKIWFCKKKKGFIPTLIEDLITRRMRVKEIIKSQKDESFAVLDARQNSLKLMANAFYGYLGFFAARWYSLECAQATTAFGRYYIQEVISKAQAYGFNVLYSDTDSIFLTLEGKTRIDAHDFVQNINKGLPGLMELDFQGFYPSGIFVSAKAGAFGAKKKYALLSENGSLKIKGFESVRRNWSSIAKESQEAVLAIILKEHDVKKASDYIKKVVDGLRNKKIPVEKVIIHTQLQKDISEYDNKGPHVAVAQRLKNQGVSVGPGTTIRYVVMQGSDIIRNRSKMPEEVKGNDYDADYYINNQVIPAVERIFNVLGYTKEELLEKKDQTKLGGFF